MHIVNKLCLVPFFAVLTTFSHLIYSTSLSCVVVFMAGIYANRLFYHLTKKIKWILLSMVLVLSISTPGQFLLNTANMNLLFELNIMTAEGLFLAARHTLNVMAMLAMIALVLNSSSKNDLIAGFYQCLKPFISKTYLDHFVVRLWLVLYYFEHHAVEFENMRDFYDAFNQLPLMDDKLNVTTLSLQPYTYLDAAVLLIIMTSTFLANSWVQ